MHILLSSQVQIAMLIQSYQIHHRKAQFLIKYHSSIIKNICELQHTKFLKKKVVEAEIYLANPCQ